MAAADGDLFVTLFNADPLVNAKPALTENGIHPVDSGYARVAAEICAQLGVPVHPRLKSPFLVSENMSRATTPSRFRALIRW